MCLVALYYQQVSSNCCCCCDFHHIFIRRICWRAAAILHFLTPCIFMLGQLVDEPTSSLTMPGGSQETAAVTKGCPKRAAWQACNSTLDDQSVMAELYCLQLKKPCHMVYYFSARKHVVMLQIILCLRTQCIFSIIRA